MVWLLPTALAACLLCSLLVVNARQRTTLIDYNVPLQLQALQGVGELQGPDSGVPVVEMEEDSSWCVKQSEDSSWWLGQSRVMFCLTASRACHRAGRCIPSARMDTKRTPLGHRVWTMGCQSKISIRYAQIRTVAAKRSADISQRHKTGGAAELE
eukprot:CAMPEP_0179475326 /NCGR_PEP_ID=MMETSP0799-20121207/54555_1 /TAXON_ID=46947 /ORGANISM="Geminigera cryophila, Strain CCMP2564" /LENGTH=154 /DNA_ID=CAMNT_0021284823 /DNA_START=27 /DNA_END=492 /DNA_ORIENTATION=-